MRIIILSWRPLVAVRVVPFGEKVIGPFHNYLEIFEGKLGSFGMKSVPAAVRKVMKKTSSCQEKRRSVIIINKKKTASGKGNVYKITSCPYACQ